MQTTNIINTQAYNIMPKESSRENWIFSTEIIRISALYPKQAN